MERYTHMSNLFYSQINAETADLLCQKTGYDQVFFANSGAEANEGAIKLARKYSFDKNNGKIKGDILTLKNSFHGRTITTLMATDRMRSTIISSPLPPALIMPGPTTWRT